MKNKSTLWIVIAIVAVLVIYFVAKPAPYQPSVESDGEKGMLSYIDVTAYDAKVLIDANPDWIIVDVSPFYDKGHIPGAVNYYFADGTLDAALASGELDKDETYIVYCHVPSASETGAQKFIDAGYMNVYRISDHYSGWVAAGFPIEM